LQRQFPGLVYTVTSSDPSRLLVSTSATSTGAPSVTITAGGQGDPLVYLQSLTNSGSASITVSAPGTQSATGTFQFTSSAAVFSLGNSNTLNLAVNGQTQQISVSISPLSPSNSTPFCCQDPRAGFIPTVAVTSSDPAVASVTPGSVTFSTPT